MTSLHHHDHEHTQSQHDHDHRHDPDHDHPAGEGYAARPHPEFVVLEIGEDVGALIVHADPAMHGVEIEISPAGDDGGRQHKEVLERRAGGAAAFTAVFDGLPAGRYTLWVDGTPRERGVRVEGGTVAELDWRDHDLDAGAAGAALARR